MKGHRRVFESADGGEEFHGVRSSSSVLSSMGCNNSSSNPTVAELRNEINVDEEADKFIQTFHKKLQIEGLNSQIAAAATARLLKQMNANSLQRIRNRSSAERDVDKSAEEFINAFHRNLLMQRQMSFQRYKEMLDRGV